VRDILQQSPPPSGVSEIRAFPLSTHRARPSWPDALGPAASQRRSDIFALGGVPGAIGGPPKERTYRGPRALSAGLDPERDGHGTVLFLAFGIDKLGAKDDLPILGCDLLEIEKAADAAAAVQNAFGEGVLDHGA